VYDNISHALLERTGLTLNESTLTSHQVAQKHVEGVGSVHTPSRFESASYSYMCTRQSS
jgi:hypothetical protein